MTVDQLRADVRAELGLEYLNADEEKTLARMDSL